MSDWAVDDGTPTAGSDWALAPETPKTRAQQSVESDDTPGDEDLKTPAQRRTFAPSGDLVQQFKDMGRQLDEQHSTAAAALNVVGNAALMGAGPAVTAGMQKLGSLRPGAAPVDYSAARAANQAQLEADRAKLGTLPTAALETVGGLVPALAAPAAPALEAASPVARGVAAGGAFGAAQGLGESASKGDLANAGTNMTRGALVGGATGGLLEGVANRAIGKAATGENDWLIHDMLGGDIKTQASPTERKVLADDEADVKYTVAQDPALRRQISKARGGDPAELDKLLEQVKGRQQAVIAPHDELYSTHDEENPQGGYRVGDMVDAVENRLKDYQRTGGSKERKALEGVRDSLQTFEGRDHVIDPTAEAYPGIPATKAIAIKNKELAAAVAAADQEIVNDSVGTVDGDGLFYSGTARLDKLRPDTSLAMSRDESLPYLDNRPGFIHKIELADDAEIATAKDMQRAAKQIGYESDNEPGSPAYLYELADSKRIREQLRKNGFDAVKYEDVGPDNSYTHDTVRLISPEKGKIVGVSSVDADGNIIENRDPALAAKAKAIKNKELAASIQSDVEALTKQYGREVYNPDKIIPTAQARQILTDLQGDVHDALGGFNERGAYKRARLVVGPIQDAFNAHLNTGDPDLVGQIRDMNRKYSALKNMEAVVKQRLNRSQQQNLSVQRAPMSLRALARGAPLTGGALMAATGHPVMGAVMAASGAAPEIARGADMALSRLILASKTPGFKGDIASLVKDAITKGVPRSLAMQFAGSANGGALSQVVP